jgi:hypothetical protein
MIYTLCIKPMHIMSKIQIRLYHSFKVLFSNWEAVNIKILPSPCSKASQVTGIRFPAGSSKWFILRTTHKKQQHLTLWRSSQFHHSRSSSPTIQCLYALLKITYFSHPVTLYFSHMFTFVSPANCTTQQTTDKNILSTKQTKKKNTQIINLCYARKRLYFRIWDWITKLGRKVLQQYIQHRNFLKTILMYLMMAV